MLGSVIDADHESKMGLHNETKEEHVWNAGEPLRHFDFMFSFVFPFVSLWQGAVLLCPVININEKYNLPIQARL